MKEFTQLPRTPSLNDRMGAQSPKVGGCVSTLFQMFDWNPGKKVFATKRLPSGRFEAEEHYVSRERSSKLERTSLQRRNNDEERRVGDDLRSAAAVKISSCDVTSSSESRKSREVDDNKRVVVPGVVARLMGLEFLPETATSTSPPTPVLLQELLRQEGFKDSKKSLKEKLPGFSKTQPSSDQKHQGKQQQSLAPRKKKTSVPWTTTTTQHNMIAGAAATDSHVVDTRIPKPPAPRRQSEEQQPKRPFLSRLQAGGDRGGDGGGDGSPAAGPVLLTSKSQNQLLSSPMRSPSSLGSKRLLLEAAAKILEPNMQPSSRRLTSPSQSRCRRHQYAQSDDSCGVSEGGGEGRGGGGASVLLRSGSPPLLLKDASFVHQRRRGGSGLRHSRTESMGRFSWNAKEDDLGEKVNGSRSMRSVQPLVRKSNVQPSNVSIAGASAQANTAKHVEVGVAAATKASLKNVVRKGSGNLHDSRLSSKSEAATAASASSVVSQSHHERMMQQQAGGNEMQAPEVAPSFRTELPLLADHEMIITTKNCSNPNPSVMAKELPLTSQETTTGAVKNELHEELVEVASWQSSGVEEDADLDVNFDDESDCQRSAQIVVKPLNDNGRRKASPPNGGWFNKAIWGRFKLQPGKQQKEIGLQGNRVFPLEKAVVSSQTDLKQQQHGGGTPHALVPVKSMARSLQVQYSRLFGLPKAINKKEEAHKKGEGTEEKEKEGLVLNHRLRNVLMRSILRQQDAGYEEEEEEQEEAPQPHQKSASSHILLTPLQQSRIQQHDDGALNLTTDGGGGREQAAVQQQPQPEAYLGAALDTTQSIDSNVHENLSACNESLQTSPSLSSSLCNRRLKRREGFPRMRTRSIDEVFPELPLEVMINNRDERWDQDSPQTTTDAMTTTITEEEQFLGFESSQRSHQESFDGQSRECRVFGRRRLSGPNVRDVWDLSEGRRRSPDVFVTEHHHLGMFPSSPLIDYETVFFPERKTPSNFQHLFAMMTCPSSSSPSSTNSPFFNRELTAGCTPQENPNLKCAQEQQPRTLFNEEGSPVSTVRLNSSGKSQLVGLSSGVDDCGQPSPVSVLESRFLDESLKTPEASLAESEQQVEKGVADVRSYVVALETKQQREERQQQRSLERIESENIKQAILTLCRSCRINVSSLRLDELTTVQQENPQDEKDYVRVVLEASEFWELKDASSSSSWKMVVPQTQSPVAALDHCLFDRLEFENIEQNKQTSLTESKLSGDDIKAGCQHEQNYSWRHCNNRKLLFDSVNEVLGLKFDCEYSSCEPWMNLRMSVRPRSFGPALVTDVYNKVCRWRELAADDDLVDNLIDQDMSVGGGKWTDFSQQIVEVALGIEQMLLKSLLEELVDDVCTISRL